MGVTEGVTELVGVKVGDGLAPCDREAVADDEGVMEGVRVLDGELVRVAVGLDVPVVLGVWDAEGVCVAVKDLQ